MKVIKKRTAPLYAVTFTRSSPNPNGMTKMNEIAAKLMGNSFYGKIMEDPANSQEWIKRMQKMLIVVVYNSPWH